MSLDVYSSAGKHRKLFYYSLALVFVLLVTAGIFAKQGWFPTTDKLSGKRTGWFGQSVAKNAPSSWNPLPMFTPTPTPLPLSKEYIYAGSRLLAVEDANASAVPPADLAIWRPSDGNWWVLGGVPGSQSVVVNWGLSGDIAAPGDYDGDGKTDFAIWRPSAHEFWALMSSNGGTGALAVNIGLTGDVPVPGDFDGDGKTDYAVFRPSEGTWSICYSADASQVYFGWGYGTDIPTSGDFDGDGKADIAVWRDSNKTFYSKNSSDGATITFTFSQNSSQPVPADYDGDGKADYAIRQSSSNNWLIHYSTGNSANETAISWQLATDLAVQNDYDGDGKVDIAVWRPINSSGQTDNGDWYIRQSTLVGQSGELRHVHWGMTGDIPVPAYFRR